MSVCLHDVEYATGMQDWQVRVLNPGNTGPYVQLVKQQAPGTHMRGTCFHEDGALSKVTSSDACALPFAGDFRPTFGSSGTTLNDLATSTGLAQADGNGKMRIGVVR